MFAWGGGGGGSELRQSVGNRRLVRPLPFFGGGSRPSFPRCDFACFRSFRARKPRFHHTSRGCGFPGRDDARRLFFFFFSRGKKKEKKKQCVRTQPAHAASGFPTARGILLMTGELINDRAAVSRLRSLVFPSCLIAARSSSVALAVRYALLRPACTGQFGTYTVSLPAIKSVGTPLLLLMRMPREAGTPPAASSHKSAGTRIIYGGMAHSRDTINVND